MVMKTSLAVALAAAGAYAQRPEDQSICDYYSNALLEESNSTTQYTLLQLVVNTAVIGNYTMPNNAMVPGILAEGEVDGETVNLAPYFTGGLVSTNAGGMARSVNFLDDGGAEPIMNNMPANSEDSNQYRLMTHLYQYFGALLGCSEYGMGDFPAYKGSNSQYKVHKFMALSDAEVTYFIQQVGASASSFGVTDEDVTTVATTLMDTFGMRCAPPATVIPDTDEELQSICTADDCPEAENAVCDQYDDVMEPEMAGGMMGNGSSMGNGTSGGMGGNGGMGGSGGSPVPTQSGDADVPMQTGAAAQVGAAFGSVAMVAAGLAAFVY